MPYFFLDPAENSQQTTPHQIFYTDNQRGKNILFFIHGWYLDSEECFAPYLELLAKDYRVVAIDLPGHGKSSQNELDEYSIDTAYRACLFLLRKIQPEGESLTLIGHSLGSFLALRLCLFAPRLVDQLVLISPVMEFSIFESHIRHLENSSRPMLLARLLWRALWVQFPFNGLTQPVFPVSRQSLWGRWLQFRKKMKNQPLPVARAYMHSFRNQNIEPLIKNNHKPTLMLYGQKDYFTSPNTASYYARAMPQAKVRIMEGCGHNLHRVQFEQVSAILQEFLQEHSRKKMGWLKIFHRKK